jgi:2-polyprenyl-3-methyl-5-hydroxy-6-metoxy-1,4-benzoquinol methylase
VSDKQKYDFIPQLDNPANVHHIELGLVPKDSYVLDVGCHTGILADALKQFNNAKVVGIDTDAAALSIARAKMKDALLLNIEETGWETVLVQQGWKNFDVILFGDVLEHTREPEAILTAAKKLLKPGGRIVVSIPNIANLRVRIGLLFGHFAYADSGILDRTHLRFFTRTSGRQMIERCGYRVTETDVAGYSLPHWLIKRFSGLLAVQLVYAAEIAIP